MLPLAARLPFAHTLHSNAAYNIRLRAAAAARAKWVAALDAYRALCAATGFQRHQRGFSSHGFPSVDLVVATSSGPKVP